MANSFFKPREGKKYKEGINGKRVLVYGASFYCNKNGQNGQRDCPHFKECTSPKIKDSSKFNKDCPEYKGKDMTLANEPTYAIDERYRAYERFGEFLKQFIDDKDVDVWDRVAFTDYLQFFSPTVQTKKEYFSERDFDSFLGWVSKLKPDVVFIWGLPVTDEVRDNPKHRMYIKDWDKLPESEYYVCHMQNIPGVEHEITLICTYHPSSIGYWREDFEKLTKYTQPVLGKQ